MVYNPDAPTPEFSNARSDEVISKLTPVRIQIMGLRSDVNAIVAIGKMSDAWFGYVSAGEVLIESDRPTVPLPKFIRRTRVLTYRL